MLLLKVQKQVKLACLREEQHGTDGGGGVAVPAATAALHFISSLWLTPQMLLPPSSFGFSVVADMAAADAATTTRAATITSFKYSIFCRFCL